MRTGQVPSFVKNVPTLEVKPTPAHAQTHLNPNLGRNFLRTNLQAGLSMMHEGEAQHHKRGWSYVDAGGGTVFRRACRELRRARRTSGPGSPLEHLQEETRLETVQTKC